MIQEIVAKKKLIMMNQMNEPFLENACCNERDTDPKQSEGLNRCIDYFIKENDNIRNYNAVVQNLSDILESMRRQVGAPYLFCKESSKNVYPPLGDVFNEETIYRAFIVFCRFNSPFPMSELFIPVCNNKPGFIISSGSANMMDTIARLKEDGRNYTQESLLRLLQIVNRENRIVVPPHDKEPGKYKQLYNVLQRLLGVDIDEETETDAREEEERTDETDGISWVRAVGAKTNGT